MAAITIKWEILKALADTLRGMNVAQVRDYTDYQCTATISVYLSTFEKEGLVYRDGKVECPHCLASKVHYRITEQGRIYVADKMATI